MSDEEKKTLQEQFVELLNSWGIKEIKDISIPYQSKEVCQDVWVIK